MTLSVDGRTENGDPSVAELSDTAIRDLPQPQVMYHSPKWFLTQRVAQMTNNQCAIVLKLINAMDRMVEDH